MTDERIKEYYEDDDIEDLVHLYLSTRNRAKKQNTQRVLLAYFGFFIVYYIILCTLFYVLDSSFSAFLVSIIPSAIAAFFHFIIHWSIYHWLISKDIESDDYIKSIENRIRLVKDNIKSMTDVEVAVLLARRLWHYAHQFSLSACVSSSKSVATIWAALLYSAHDSFGSARFSHLIANHFRETVPSDYEQGFKSPDTARAMYDARDYIPTALLESNNSLTTTAEIESFFTTYGIRCVDGVPAFQRAIYDTKRYIRTILDARKPTYKWPTFLGSPPR